MTKQEFLQAKKERVEKLSLEQLRRAYTNLDDVAQNYFKEMNKSHEKIKELEMQLFHFRSLESVGAK